MKEEDSQVNSGGVTSKGNLRTRRTFFSAAASLVLMPGASEAATVVEQLTPGAQGTEINGKVLQTECRGARGQSCNVWVPPEIEASPTATKGPKGKVTAKAFIDLRIVKDYNREVLEDGVVRGRVVFGLYGSDAPKTVEHFLKFIEGTEGPSYASGIVFRHEPGKWIEGGRISGLYTTDLAGQEVYEYLGKVVNLKPLLEGNDLKHETKALLTHRKFNPGPEFGVTLAPSPELDGFWTVFGEVLEGQEFIEEVARLPYVTGKSVDPSGSASDQWWQAQNRYFLGLAKQFGDTRANKKYPGKLLRRVEMTKCGILS